jgi:hypothetical protein
LSSYDNMLSLAMSSKFCDGFKAGLDAVLLYRPQSGSY